MNPGRVDKVGQGKAQQDSRILSFIEVVNPRDSKIILKWLPLSYLN